MASDMVVVHPSGNDKVISVSAALMERALIIGDLSQLTPRERVEVYRLTCESLGLNPLTKPFEYILLDKKLTLYARKDCTDQLRKREQAKVEIVAREKLDGLYVVTARASLPNGRVDESIGAVSLEREDGEWKTGADGKAHFKGNGTMIPLRGEALANALMKAETKAKRRATLSLIGLGILDETEVETIVDAETVDVDPETGEIRGSRPTKARREAPAFSGMPAASPKPEATDPASIQNVGQFFAACLKDFRITRTEVLKELGVASIEHLAGIPFTSLYAQVAAVRNPPETTP